MRLVAGLRPDPMGKLKRSPRPSSRNWGCLLLIEGRKGRREGRGWEEEGRKEEEGTEGRGRTTASHTIFRPCCMDRENTEGMGQLGKCGDTAVKCTQCYLMCAQLAALSLPCFSAWLNRRPTGPVPWPESCRLWSHTIHYFQLVVMIVWA